MAQPADSDEGLIDQAQAHALRMSTSAQPMGQPGPLLDPHSPFLVGMAGAAGVAVTVGVVAVVITARSVLVLIGLALFIAVGLQPVVAWLGRRGLPRWAAVTVVCVALFVIVGGFLSAAIPALATQANAFAAQAPAYLHALSDRSSFLGRLNEQFHVQQSVEQTFNTGAAALVGGVLGAGLVVLDVLASTLVVVILLVYFLSALPRLRTGLHRLVPHSRRPRAILFSDEIESRVGGYVLGTAVVSLIAGTLTFIWLLILGVPFPLLLALLVALLDLIPVIGSTTAGILVSLVALTVSLPVGLATAGFFVVYRFAEDYLLVPRIVGRAVKVSALATVVAVLIGAVLFGVLGALVAIPAAAAIQLIVLEVAIPKLDRS